MNDANYRPTALSSLTGLGLWPLLQHRARISGEKTAMVWQPFDRPPRSWTFGELARDVAATAAGLTRRGIRPKDRVLLHLENCPEFVISWLACAAVGAVAVATNTRSTDAELSYFVDDSDVRAVITQPKFTNRLERIAVRASWLVSISHDAGAEPTAGFQSDSASSFGALAADPSTFEPLRADLAAPLCVQYTSGTTSRPKGVVWSHANGVWAARTNAVHEGLRPDDTYLCYLPLFHTNALSYTVLSCLWAGARFVLIPKWSTSRFWEISTRHRCTWLNTIGLTMRAIAELEPPAKHSYRVFGTGACDVEWDSTLGIKSLGWYGMTETVSHPIVGDLYTPNRAWSMGRPASEYEVAIVREDESPVDYEETGELLVRGQRGVSLFAEYLNSPQATAESFTDGGWFRTGDRVTWHEDGHVSYADRAKDVLRVGGENVAASEVERIIQGVPGVVEVAVVSKPDFALDEVPVAFVIAKGDADAIREAVLVECADRLASFKVPREVIVVEDFPRSTLAKINKARLREVAAEDRAERRTP